MKTADIKKVLYKEKPKAHYVYSISHPILRMVTHWVFEANCSIGTVKFVIPVKETPNSLSVHQAEDAQLLIRWLVNDEETVQD